MEDTFLLQRFVPDSSDGVFQKLCRSAVETFRNRLSRGSSFYQVVSSEEIAWQRLIARLDERDFVPTALLLSSAPQVGIEFELNGQTVQLFCTENGTNDALVMVVALKTGFPSIWSQFFVPQLALYS